ncbi:MAG: biotin synthase BioB [Syntrophus sp. (in: bacteria)]|nr:biotin synthase BioB [Syntrophus sp. (in: bacteria)]
MPMDIIEKLQRQVLSSKDIGADDALRLFEEGATRPFRVMAAAAEIRRHFKGDEISLCSIVNAKSGKCPEDCKFCAQSAHHATDVESYPLKKAAEIIKEAEAAGRAGAEMFGIVTSGKRIKAKKEWAEIIKAIRGINALGMKACASLGMIDEETARTLKDAGLYRYHHNLETSRSFFPQICTTHAYDEDVETVRAAQAAGLSVCCGGIIGLGEGIRHRIELAFTLRELNVDSVPVNILNPIKGTPLGQAPPLPPLEILMTISVFRFLLPDRDIKLSGGKEKNLRQLLPLAIVAGANSLMTGHYLTTQGRNAALDIEMIKDLGLKATREPEPVCSCMQGD